MSDKLRWLEGAKRAEELLAQERLPSPKPPEHLLGQDYDFPTDPATLTSSGLGRLMLQLAALRGWAKDRVGREDLRLHELELVFDYLVPLQMAELVLGDELKNAPRAALVKEVLRSKAIDGDEKLKRLFHRIVEAKARVQALQTQLEIYESHYYALSREQSRREAGARAGVVE